MNNKCENPRRIKSILSIDFDYFQDASPDVFSSYPDGIDLPTDISNVVWICKYAFSRDRDKILTVKPLTQELKCLEELLTSQDPSAKVLVSQSHLSIYK